MVLGVGFGPVPFPATLLGGGAEQCELSSRGLEILEPSKAGRYLVVDSLGL